MEFISVFWKSYQLEETLGAALLGHGSVFAVVEVKIFGRNFC